MIADLRPFTGVPAKAVLSRRSDFAAFYQVIIENITLLYCQASKKEI
jgi:hypothetical protein